MQERKLITHKELLSFSNLTNLAWHFVDLRPKQKTNQNGEVKYIYSKLQELFNPKSFMRKDAEGKFVKYEYMENVKSEDDITQKDMDEGLFKLRKHAGIAMEYLEKDEDNFMKDWEVIYAADSYKVVKDYIDNIQEKIQRKLGIQPDKKAKYYPTRKELEKIEEKQRWVEIGYKALSTGLDIGLNWANLSKETFKLTDEIVKNVKTNVLKELAKEVDNVALQLLALGYLSRSDLRDVCKDLGETGGKAYVDMKEQEKFVDELHDILKNSTVLITEKLNMDDTGFRVLVLRKGDEIVIAYKGNKTDDRELLPEEKDYLQIIYNKIVEENQGCNITFTGYEGGAELSFLNVLSTPIDDERLTKKEEVKIITKEIYEFQEGDTLWDLAEEKLGDSTLWTTITRKSDGARYTEETAKRIPIGELVCIPDEKTIEINNNANVTAALFYNKIEDVKGFIDFTPKDLDKNYVSNITIEILSTAKKVTKSMAKKTFLIVATAAVMAHYGKTITIGVLSGNIIMVLVGLLVSAGMSLLSKWVDNMKLDNIYEDLIGLELIEKKQNSIQGYITNNYMNSKYIELRTEQDELIKVKKEHAIFLIVHNVKENHQSINGSIRKCKDSGYKVRNEILRQHVGTKSASHTIEYWKLEKNRWGIYEITKVRIENMSASREVHQSINYISFESKHKEEISSGVMTANLLQVLGIIQRNYETKRHYYFEYMYPTTDGIKVSRVLPQVLEENEPVENLDLANEFLFMPYIGEDGKIGTELRKDYIASVIKSSLIYDYIKEKWLHDHRRQGMYGFDNKISSIKYSSEELDKITIDFEERDINRKLISKMVEIQFGAGGSPRSHYSRTSPANCKVSPFHYKRIINMLREDEELFENIYDVENTKEVDRRFALFWTDHDVDGEVIFDNEDSLEYKYNPNDYIIGGKLVINALDLSDEWKEKEDKKEVAFTEVPQEEKLPALEINERIEKGGNVVCYQDTEIEVTRAYSKDDNIDIFLEDKNNKNYSREKNSSLLKESFMA